MYQQSGVNDESMLMWIVYSCEEGTDDTKTDIPSCSSGKTKCEDDYACTKEDLCEEDKEEFCR